MNKEDWIRTGIKLFGIYLIVMAIVSLPNAITDTYTYFSTQNMCNGVATASDTDSAKNFIKQACVHNFSSALKSSLSLIIYLLFGIYFMGSGQLANRILGNKSA